MTIQPGMHVERLRDDASFPKGTIVKVLAINRYRVTLDWPDPLMSSRLWVSNIGVLNDPKHYRIIQETSDDILLNQLIGGGTQ